MRKALAITLLALFAISTQSYYFDNQYHHEINEHKSEFSTPLGQATTISIGSYPNGAVEKVSVSVPDGEVIQSMDLDLESAPLLTSTAFSFTDSVDFSTGTEYIRIDANQSYISAIPPSGRLAIHQWDFDTLQGRLPQGWSSTDPNAGLINDNTLTGSTLTNANYLSCGTLGGNGGSLMFRNSESTVESNTIDISNFGNINISFWLKEGVTNCGEDPDIGDDLAFEYFSSDQVWVKINNCNPTNTCPQFTATFGLDYPTGYVNYQLPANASWPGFKFKFYMTGGSGTSFDWWFIDDLSITIPDLDDVDHYWISDEINLETIGIGEPRSYSLLYLDAEVPDDSKLELSILDSISNQTIEGFSNITGFNLDLGMIDYKLHPKIKVRLDMEISSSGKSPIVHGIHFEGEIEESFGENPVNKGWTLNNANWNNGQISGSGFAQSPEFFVRSGFSGLKSESFLTGAGRLEYSLDSGVNWNQLKNNTLEALDKPHFKVMLRVFGTGTNWALDLLSVELVRTSVPDGLEIDIGLDGTPEWTMEGIGVGRLGIQDVLTDGSRWTTSQSTPSAPSSLSFYLPNDGIDELEFAVATTGDVFIDPYMTLSIGFQDIITSSLDDFSTLDTVRLSDAQIDDINIALSQAVIDNNLNGFDLVEVTIKIGSSSTTTTIISGGLMAIYDSNLELDFSGSDTLLINMNRNLNNAIPLNGMREISIPIRMYSTGSISMTINSITSVPSIIPISIEVSNVTNTFTPSMDWIDITSTFDFSGIGVLNPAKHVKDNGWLVELNLVGNNQSAQIRCSTVALPVNGQTMNNCLESGVELIWSDLGTSGIVSMSEDSTFLHLVHRFKFPVEWDDEEFLVASTNLVSGSGPMLPVSKSFGLGNALGVENDISVKNWEVVGLNGIGSDINYPYLKKGEPVTVNVHLGFEGDESTSPRTGHALVRLLVEGNEYGSSSIINDGVASIQWVVPSVGDDVNLEIDVLPLKNQDVSYEVPRQIEFGYDSVSPQLLYMNVDEFDHFESSPSKVIEFTITDRPVLPSQAEINIWRSWIDDLNMNGEIDLGEFSTNELHMPDNLMTLEGVYDYSLDTSSAPDGGYVRGWITVADSAGNVLPNSGNLTNPLFNLLISSDGSPQLGYSELAWEFGNLPWLHPGENISLQIPVWDKNGITDITEMELDLSINQPDSSTIFWNRQTDICSSSTLYIEIMTCSMVGDTGTGLFTNSGQFSVTFQLKWGFDPDDSVIRTPNLVLRDLKGQSTVIQLTELNWRYSGEMSVDQSSMEYSITGNNESSSGAWVMAREEIGISGTLEWIKTGRTVNQELQLMYNLGLNIANVEYSSGMFNGTIITPASSGNYALDISLHNAPNGASITAPTSPLLWFIVDDEAPSMVNIDSPSLSDEIKEDQWSNIKLKFTMSENLFLDEESVYLSWEVHPSGFGFSSSSIANGTDLIQLLGGQPFGDMINAQMSIDLDSVIPVETRTEALELRIWIFGSDMAGNTFGSVSDEIFSPFAVWQLEQQLPEYVLTQPSIGTNSDVNVGTPLDLSVVIQNVGQSDGFAQLRVERVESNGARTIIHTQEVKVQSGGSGFFNHRWTPDRDGSMWIEFIIVGGPTSQTETFYANDGESDGFFGGIAEINPVLLIVIFLLIASLIGLIVFGLRTPNANNNQRSPPNKNYQKATGQIPMPQQNSHYAQQQVVTSPGDNPYQ